MQSWPREQVEGDTTDRKDRRLAFAEREHREGEHEEKRDNGGERCEDVFTDKVSHKNADCEEQDALDIIRGDLNELTDVFNERFHVRVEYNNAELHSYIPSD